jgi:hypothetical protein
MNFTRGIEVLKTGRFRLSSIGFFNDPFDGYGVTVGEMSDEACWHFVKRFRNELERLFIDPSMSQKKSALLKEASDEQYVYILQETFKNPLQSYFTAEAIREWICGKQFQLMCLSSVENYYPSNDILMWSHYADSCKGIRFEIDLSEIDMLPGFTLRKMKYGKKRPVLNLSKVNTWDNADAEFTNYVDNCICTKSDAWQYEAEERFIVDLKKCKYNIHKGYDNQDKFEYVYLTFPSNVLRKVFFGCAADRSEVMNLYRDLKQKPELKNVSFLQMELDLKDYRIKYNKIC